MNPSPKKRRWQFSLKVLLIVITMAGVGMGLIRIGWKSYSHDTGVDDVFFIGYYLLTASPGVLIGYGYGRLKSAIIGGIVSVVVSYYLMINWIIPLTAQL